VNAEIVDTVKFSNGDIEEAAKLSTGIDSVLETIAESHKSLSSNCIALGSLLKKVRDKQYWRLYNHPTFGSYIDSVMEKTGRGRTQIYAYISTVEKLGKYVPEEKLLEMGISKASELAKLMGKTGAPPTPELVATASDESVTLAELKASIFETTNIKDDFEKGTYYDFGGAYLTAGEKDEFDRAFETACQIDPVISKEFSDTARKKEVLLRWVREFLATYESLAAKGMA